MSQILSPTKTEKIEILSKLCPRPLIEREGVKCEGEGDEGPQDKGERGGMSGSE